MTQLKASQVRNVSVVSLLIALALGACAGPESIYEARVRRTAFGIAHIEANSLANLGFGEGYAQAEDHLCSIADQVVRARGERARYLGPGENQKHLRSDLAMRALAVHSRAADDLAQQPQEIRDWYQAYVTGYNDYLGTTGATKVKGWCRGAEWVFPISATDLAAYHRVLHHHVLQLRRHDCHGTAARICSGKHWAG